MRIDILINYEFTMVLQYQVLEKENSFSMLFKGTAIEILD